VWLCVPSTRLVAFPSLSHTYAVGKRSALWWQLLSDQKQIHLLCSIGLARISGIHTCNETDNSSHDAPESHSNALIFQLHLALLLLVIYWVQTGYLLGTYWVVTGYLLGTYTAYTALLGTFGYLLGTYTAYTAYTALLDTYWVLTGYLPCLYCCSFGGLLPSLFSNAAWSGSLYTFHAHPLSKSTLQLTQHMNHNSSECLLRS